MNKILKTILRFIGLILIDLFAYYVSLLLAVFTRSDIATHFYRPVSGFLFSYPYYASAWQIPAIFIAVMWFEKLYQLRYPFWEELKVILKATTVTILFVFFLYSVRKIPGDLTRMTFLGEISRLTFVFLWIFLSFIAPLFRYFGKRLLFKIGIWRENVMVIGANDTAVSTIRGLHNEPELGYQLIGFLDDKITPDNEIEIKGKKYKVFGKTKHIKKFITLLNVSTVIIALPHLSRDELGKMTADVQKLAKSVLVVPDLSGLALVNTELHYLFMQKIFLLKINNNLLSTINRLIKRLFDISLSLIMLPFILLFIAIVSVLIKLDSKGPVFIIQERLGKNGNIFKCIKFRTMFLNSDSILDVHIKNFPEVQEQWVKYKKIKGYDPRVTKIGSFLRKTSLDEIPQIFNVLHGKMCLVGPRPYLPREWDEIKGYVDIILLTTPGVTGLWQISGRNELIFEERMKLDTWYVQNWSLWLDIMILFKTIDVVLRRKGAY